MVLMCPSFLCRRVPMGDRCLRGSVDSIYPERTEHAPPQAPLGPGLRPRLIFSTFLVTTRRGTMGGQQRPTGRRAKDRGLRSERLARQLQGRIESGEYAPGESFPTVVAIVAESGLSRNTVLAALRWLASAGLIRRVGAKRLGYRVVPPTESPERIDTAPLPLPVKVVLPFEYWNYVTSSILHAVEARFSRAGIRLMLTNNRNEPGEERHVLERVAEFELDSLSALVLITSRPPESVDLDTLRCIRSRMPLVQVDRSIQALQAHYVGVDNRSIGRRAVRHLVARGCRRIAFVSGFMGISTGHERLAGYRAGLDECGLSIDPTLVCAENRQSVSVTSVAELGAEAARRLLATGPVDGVVCNSDKSAVGVIRALHERGLRVPADVRVVGCDNDELIAASSGIRITGFAYPYEQLADEILVLIRRLAHRPTLAPSRVELEAPFVVGETG
ncbi:MAG: substrate-binding domain-containing protein [Chitinivibrionales bacterium]|nr:substrate-binding domain-containing protein [Chitinivibrionales bacterium]